MAVAESKLVQEIEHLSQEFNNTTAKLIKDIKRHDKIMARSDKRQRQEYDELQYKLKEVEKLQEAQKDLLDSFIKLLASAIDENQNIQVVIVKGCLNFL